MSRNLELENAVDELDGVVVERAFCMLNDIIETYTESREPDIKKIEIEYKTLQTKMEILFDYMVRIREEIQDIAGMVKPGKEEAA